VFAPDSECKGRQNANLKKAENTTNPHPGTDSFQSAVSEPKFLFSPFPQVTRKFGKKEIYTFYMLTLNMFYLVIWT
jgi:hypothetical protein